MTRRRRLTNDEAGLATTELAVLMPVLLVMVLFPIQMALFWHARQAANLAAEEAVGAAKIAGVDPYVDGRAAAVDVLGQVGHLERVSIAVTPTADTVGVEVRGVLGFSVLPWSWSVVGYSEAPLERWVPE